MCKEIDKETEINRLYQALLTGLLISAIHEHTGMKAKPWVALFDDGVDAGFQLNITIEDRDKYVSASIKIDLDKVECW
jgi:hypothetical protein